MSTRNLARAVIEGGREHGMKRRCRYGDRAPRATTRSAIARLDVRDADTDEWIIPRPPKVGRWRRPELRRAERRLDGRVATHQPARRPERVLIAWLSGRRVGALGDSLFWFVPTPRGGYRHSRLLDRHETALWRSLPDWFRACHDPFVSAARLDAARVS
jgi:hypothetical protein